MKGLVLTAVTTLLVGPVLGLAVLTGASSATDGIDAATVALCQTSGPVTGLDATQARNARTVVAATQQATVSASQSPAAQSRAELITLMTAATESTLHNYANPGVPASELLFNDGQPPSGGDHDSVGLFQQRASWGPLTARMNPAAAAQLFVTRLLAVPAWATIPPGVAAQTVQVSKYPGRYASTETSAQAWLRQIAGTVAAATCGGDGLQTRGAGTVRPGTVPAGYTIPATATDAERHAVTFALAQLGKPYIFGASGPDSYDCSGLTMAAWAAAGVQLPHYTVAQYQLGTPVAATSLLAPGDLIFIPGDDGSLIPPNPQHVGIYLGDGYVIEAPQTGDVVKIVPLAAFTPIIGMRHVG
jgi:cell wall-associated NlpC family hydrolase